MLKNKIILSVVVNHNTCVHQQENIERTAIINISKSILGNEYKEGRLQNY